MERGQPLRVALLIFSLLFCLPIAAQSTQSRLEIMLTAAGATPQQVVDGFQSGSTSLAGFSAPNKPDSVHYLLRRRAQGDFLAYLLANPKTARAKLERMLVATYASDTVSSQALAALKNDPNVEAVTPALDFQFSSATLQSFDVVSSLDFPIVGNQYGRTDLNIDAAWALAGGHALVADVDSGLRTNHPDLQAFSGSVFQGGNFLPVYAFDLGSQYDPDGIHLTDTSNVDEAKSVWVTSGSACDDGTSHAKAAAAGHGTHVAGLIAANSLMPDGLAGTCANCGIMEWKISNYICKTVQHKLYPQINQDVIGTAITYASDTGAQIINQSFGAQSTTIGYCAANPGNSICNALVYASSLDVVLTAASGNARLMIQFPASDSRVIAVGGFDQTLALWDLSPGSYTNCPPSSQTGEPLGYECGSDYTTNTTDGSKKQELVASAYQVESTVYPGLNWNNLGCGDGYGPGTTSDGIGWCTGTSMSSPQVAGIVGILRSINPLIHTGDPAIPSVLGIRNVLVNTTVQALLGVGWDARLGYGRPDAAAAARMMLGKADGVTVKNRVTPLFHLYSSAATDHAYTTSPQTAVALIRNGAHAYLPLGTPVTGYSAFPNDPNGTTLPAPRADIFVLSTEYKPRPSDPALVPLYILDRPRNWPLGCTSGNSGCNSVHDDFLLVTTVNHLQTAVAAGYSYRGVQGYIYQPCTPEPKCIPQYAQHVWHECETSIDDCAIFLDNDKTNMEGQGYTTAYPAGSNMMIGYAFPNIDTDGDGLVDGFEYVIGTNPNLVDSNGDGVHDDVQFPMAGVSISDPCLGANNQCPGDDLFKNSFEN